MALIQAVIEEARAKRVTLTISTARINPARTLYGDLVLGFLSAPQRLVDPLAQAARTHPHHHLENQPATSGQPANAP